MDAGGKLLGHGLLLVVGKIVPSGRNNRIIGIVLERQLIHRVVYVDGMLHRVTRSGSTRRAGSGAAAAEAGAGANAKAKAKAKAKANADARASADALMLL